MMARPAAERRDPHQITRPPSALEMALSLGSLPGVLEGGGALPTCLLNSCAGRLRCTD
jgi:hypothetical protein